MRVSIKKFFMRIPVLFLLAALVFSGLAGKTVTAEAASVTGSSSSTPVQLHGALSVDGADLVDEHGEKVQLRGVSTHGLAWFPQYVNEGAFRTLRDTWGANLVRLALYTDEYGGYCSGGNQADLEAVVDRGVQAAEKLGMYVIIDWHVLNDRNPQKYETQAKAFFKKMSAKYAGQENVLYEICNEPNGNVSWSDVKAYAEDIIPVIRANAPDAVILVGTPTWSQDIDKAAADPIRDGGNLMYTLHFYAATHKDDLRNKLKKALDGGTPVFISEFSTCEASGSGGIDEKSAEAWKQLIEKYHLSYAGWSLCNKNESSAILKSGVSATDGGWSDRDLSDTGRWLKNLISADAEKEEQETADSDMPFRDVRKNAYYAKAVRWAVKEKITSGISANTFSPDTPCTRGQMVTFLYRYAGSPAVSASTKFRDVGQNSFCAKPVAWAAGQGITSGTSADRFSPDMPCTRSQMAVFLWRMQKKPSASVTGEFRDVSSGVYYAEAVYWAKAAGITSGTASGTFSPDQACTRGQMVTFLWHLAGSPE